MSSINRIDEFQSEAWVGSCRGGKPTPAILDGCSVVFVDLKKDSYELESLLRRLLQRKDKD